MNLEHLGADSATFRAFERYAAQGLMLARVALSSRDQYRLFTASGECAAEASGALWHGTPNPAGMPVVGDWVAARMAGPEQATVEAVLPRHTILSRRAPGRREDQQPIAANIDLVFLVCGLDGDFNLRRLERYLTLAAESRVAAVVVLNKSDLCANLPSRLTETMAVARGAPVVPATTQRSGGLRELTAFLAPRRTVALLGSSGVGKSTIVNRLLGEERLRTAKVRPSDSRGRHATTHRELMPLPAGGALIDTPGMRELQLWAGTESVQSVFEEISAIAARCRFRDCGHAGELGCAVETAVRIGTVAPERWESYRKLRAEARRHEELADPFLAQQRKRQLKQIHKAAREMYKYGRH